jgi:hypothetical protein
MLVALPCQLGRNRMDDFTALLCIRGSKGALAGRRARPFSMPGRAGSGLPRSAGARDDGLQRVIPGRERPYYRGGPF